ncbi:MAG: cytochrome c class [Actinomycetia bacterium]|nr:cytochrome c class [Actinomycetes bacterium]
MYLRDCAVCHGARAGGTPSGPSLRGVGAASVDYWVSTGRMPLSSPHETPRRHKPKYKPALEHALVQYVARLGGGGPAIPDVVVTPALVPPGGVQYRLNCAACHSWAGTGGALLHVQAPPLKPATPTQIAEAVRTGPGNMPAFGRAALTPKQLNGVVAYVRYLDHPVDRGGNPLWYLGPFAEGAVIWILGIGVVLLVIRVIGTRS